MDCYELSVVIYRSAADQFLAILPNGKLAGNHGSLGLVEKEIDPFGFTDNAGFLELLAISDSSEAFSFLAGCEGLIGTDPVNFILFNKKSLFE